MVIEFQRFAYLSGSTHYYIGSMAHRLDDFYVFVIQIIYWLNGTTNWWFIRFYDSHYYSGLMAQWLDDLYVSMIQIIYFLNDIMTRWFVYVYFVWILHWLVYVTVRLALDILQRLLYGSHVLVAQICSSILWLLGSHIRLMARSYIPCGL